MTADSHSFVVVCMCCGREKTRQLRIGIGGDRVSHGLCEPMCAEGVALYGQEIARKLNDRVKEAA